MLPLTRSKPQSPFQDVYVVHVDRFEMPVRRDSQRESDGGLRGSYGNDENHEYLADRAFYILRSVEGLECERNAMSLAKCHQDDIAGIEHDFQRHQDGNRVASGQRSIEPYAKKQCAEHDIEMDR